MTGLRQHSCSSVTGLIVTVASWKFRETWRQRRGVRTTRLRRPRSALFVICAFASTASRANVRDDRETPLLVGAG